MARSAPPTCTDLRLLAAMLELPRERFFPDDKASLAYLDLDVAVSAPGSRSAACSSRWCWPS
jgi:protein-L-isoaspartate(D-aspartate) O-methyltransferase